MVASRDEAEDVPVVEYTVPFWVGAIADILSQVINRPEMRAMLSADRAYCKTFGEHAFERMKTGNLDWVRYFEEALYKIAEEE